MRSILAGMMLLMLAQAGDVWRPFETLDQSRQRHSAERYQYEQQRQQPNVAPFAYPSDRFGDPAPPGTFRPGYETPYQQPFKPRQQDRF